MRRILYIPLILVLSVGSAQADSIFCKKSYGIYWELHIEDVKTTWYYPRSNSSSVSKITKVAKNRFGDVFVTDRCMGDREKKVYARWGCYALEVRKKSEVREIVISYDKLDAGIYESDGGWQKLYQCELKK